MDSDRFICGCTRKEVERYSISTVAFFAGGPPALSNRRYDSQGYEVCPQHSARLFGYNSPRAGSFIDWSKLSSGKSVNVDFGREPDRRDLRDPEELGKKILAKGNGSA